MLAAQARVCKAPGQCCQQLRYNLVLPVPASQEGEKLHAPPAGGCHHSPAREEGKT